MRLRRRVGAFFIRQSYRVIVKLMWSQALAVYSFAHAIVLCSTAILLSRLCCMEIFVCASLYLMSWPLTYVLFCVVKYYVMVSKLLPTFIDLLEVMKLTSFTWLHYKLIIYKNRMQYHLNLFKIQSYNPNNYLVTKMKSFQRAGRVGNSVVYLIFIIDTKLLPQITEDCCACVFHKKKVSVDDAAGLIAFNAFCFTTIWGIFGVFKVFKF